MKPVFTKRPSILVSGILCALLLGGIPASGQGTTPYGDHPVTVTTTAGENAGTTPTASGPAAPSPEDAANLTDEERELMALKLLPVYYPVLKTALEKPYLNIARAKRKARQLFAYRNAVYSPNFGDPQKMLEWARRYRTDAAMVRFCASTVPGDIILTGHKTVEGQKNDPIAILTGGRFHHAVTVIDGPPCVFIEAVGATGSKTDPTNNRVRLSSWFEQLASWAGMRIIRPTAGMPKAQADRVIDGTIKYLVDQLGKPYDYGFTNSDANRAFYCSELAWKAYNLGGGMKSYKPDKSPTRDRMIVALNAVVDGLEPKDRISLANRVMTFVGEYTSQQPPDLKKLTDFIVDELTPACGTMEKTFPTPEAREKLRTVLEKVRNNQAFPSFLKAQQKYQAARQSGKFNAGWGIGNLRKLTAEAEIAGSLAADLNALVKESGAGYAKTAKLVFSLALPMYKYLGTYANFLTGMDKEGKVSVPDGVKTVLSITNWVADRRESVKKWPVIGPTLANLLPGNGDAKVQETFTSPTDLADTSPNFHLDYP